MAFSSPEDEAESLPPLLSLSSLLLSLLLSLLSYGICSYLPALNWSRNKFMSVSSSLPSLSLLQSLTSSILSFPSLSLLSSSSFSSDWSGWFGLVRSIGSVWSGRFEKGSSLHATSCAS